MGLILWLAPALKIGTLLIGVRPLKKYGNHVEWDFLRCFPPFLTSKLFKKSFKNEPTTNPKRRNIF
jgi:hypothetical protein